MRRTRTVVADDAVAEGEVVSRRAVVERPPWSPAQLVAVVIGIIFIVVGGIALAKTGVQRGGMTVEHSDTPLWHHTAWLALFELAYGLLMIAAGVVPGGARAFMTFMGMIGLAFGIAVLVASDTMNPYFGTHDGAGWGFIVAGAVTLIAAAVSPVFYTGERASYGRRREVVA
jgi:hypothetical protein